MLKICHIARDIRASGGGEVVKQVAHHQAMQGVQVVVITDSTDVDLGPAVKILRTPLGQILLDWVPNSRAGWVVRHAAQIFTFTVTSSAVAVALRLRGFTIFNHNCESLVGQILVMHNVFSAELAARPLSRKQRFVALLNPIRFVRIVKELLLSRSVFGKILVSVSEGARSDVENLAGGSDRVAVIPNGVDVDKFSESSSLRIPDFVKAWKRDDIHRVILFIGHEWKRKGLDELLIALSLLPADYGLIIVGGASQNQNLYKSKSDDLSISRRVLFAGERMDVRPFLAAADVFCLPSHSETMPLVALEALAAGLPIVLTPQCPASDFIIEGVSGAITSGRPQQIADAVQRTATIVSTASDIVRIKETVSEKGWSSVAREYSELAVLCQQRKSGKSSPSVNSVSLKHGPRGRR